MLRNFTVVSAWKTHRKKSYTLGHSSEMLRKAVLNDLFPAEGSSCLGCDTVTGWHSWHFEASWCIHLELLNPWRGRCGNPLKGRNHSSSDTELHPTKSECSASLLSECEMLHISDSFSYCVLIITVWTIWILHPSLPAFSWACPTLWLHYQACSVLY